MASAICVFNPKKFYEILVSSQNIVDKLSSLLISCNQNNIQYMFSAVTVLQEVLQSKKQLPLTKYNALITVKQILQCSTYMALYLLQTYIIPLLKPIAILDLRKRSDQELQRYFIDLGFRQTVGIRLVGKKFVLLSAQVMYSAAVIRPKLNILHQEIDLASKCEELFNDITKRCILDKQRFACLNLQKNRQKYFRDLKAFDPSKMSGFLGKALKQQIIFQKGVNGPFKKLIQSQDCFISIPIINTCVSILSKVSHDFPHKKHYLNLFSFYIKQGNIYAIVVAHNAGFIRSIFDQIVKVPGNLGLSYGKSIYPQIQASLQQKYEFYSEFLRCLMVWAICLPTNEVGQVSQLKTMYDYLRKDLHFQFPQILMLQKVQNQFADNLQKRQIQNQQILRMMEEQDNLFSKLQSIKMNSQVSLLKEKVDTKQIQFSRKFPQSTAVDTNVEKAQKIIQYESSRKKKNITNNTFKELLNQICYHFDQLHQRTKVDQSMHRLKQLKQQWSKLQKSNPQTVSSQVKAKGDKYCLKIRAIQQLYLKLSKKEMSFRVFNYKLNIILQPGDSSDQSSKQKSDKEDQNRQKLTVSGFMLQFESNCHKQSKLKLQINSIKGDRNKQTINSLKRVVLSNAQGKKKNSSEYDIFSQHDQSESSGQASEQKSQKESQEIKHSLVKVNSMKEKSSGPIYPVTHEPCNQYGIQQLMKKRKQPPAQSSDNSISQQSEKKSKQNHDISSVLEPQNSSEMIKSQTLDYNDQISSKNQKVEKKESSRGRKSTLSRRSVLSDRSRLKMSRESKIKLEGNNQSKQVITNTVPHQSGIIELKQSDRLRKTQKKSINNSVHSAQNSDYFQSNNTSVQKQYENSVSEQKSSELINSIDSVKNSHQNSSLNNINSSVNNISSSVNNVNSSINNVNSSINNQSNEIISNPVQLPSNRILSEQIVQAQKTQTKKSNVDKEESVMKKSQNHEKDVDEFKSSVENFFNNQVHQVYQISAGKQQKELFLKPNLQKVKGFNRDRLSFKKVIDTITSKSIQAYRASLSKRSDKAKSLSKNTSANASRSSSRSIIKRQYQRLNCSLKTERHPNMSQSLTKKMQNTILPSSLMKQKSKTISKVNEVVDYELVTSKYAPFFPQKQHSKTVRSCLQNKGVLFDSKQLQVGYVHFLKGKQLDFTLFLTAQINISSIKIGIQSDENVHVNFDTRELVNLVEGRQQVVKIQTFIKNMPFKMPILRLWLKEKRNHKQNQIVLPFPCSINKYSIFQHINQEKYLRWEHSNSKTTKYRTYSFKILKKIQKNGNIQKYLPFFSAARVNEGKCCLISEFIFGGEKGLVQLVQEDKYAWHLTGKVEGKGRYIQFVLSSLFFLLAQ